MAQEILASRNSPVINSASYQTTTLGEFVDSTQNQDMSSESSNVEFSRMAPLNRNFKAGGFSESARNLLNASWRKGTQQDYIAKFEKYSSWCTGKQIDPYSATLSQIADFLASLFESGLQYRTISGYRSMLSAVLSPIDNYLVGQHPYISRLIKGVFHSRPPKTNFLPELDLEIVLKALENEPFEPLCEASLNGAMIINGWMKLESEVLQGGMNFTAESEAVIDFKTDVDFSDMPFKMCLQMMRPPLQYKYNLDKFEKSRFLKKRYRHKKCVLECLLMNERQKFQAREVIPV
ncbi:unnamed protein product [Mytilus coruscus]|uniref:MTP large subunit lipid-binding domain-containing protein n=1 Tax=Mytilus coruscus TaxID=42192 RepID=A0A6J8ANW9_MYTCO|nr:unnamed protein product [Mytilus coruscus]